MVVEETIAYASVLLLTVVFTVMALVVKDKLWRVALKFIAGLFWIIMSIGQFVFFGAASDVIVLSLPYAIFGMVFWIAIYNDFLSEKKNRVWDFDDI